MRDFCKELDDLVLSGIEPPNRSMAPVGWCGGKGRMLKKILPLIDSCKHHVYVEPFCGAASVYWAKKPSPVEVLNDLNGDLINLFRVLQDKTTFAEFRHRVIWTPYSRAEFVRAFNYNGTDPVMRAWAFYVRQNQGFGGIIPICHGNWGRAFVSDSGMAGTVSRWLRRMKCLDAWHKRISRAQIDNRDALEVIRYWDTPDTLFYVDPPYVLGTRKDKKAYTHEMTDEQHMALVDLLLSVKGKVIVSGYENDIYVALEKAGWTVQKHQTACHAAGRVRGSGLRGEGAATKKAPRTECLWVSPRVGSGDLFNGRSQACQANDGSA